MGLWEKLLLGLLLGLLQTFVPRVAAPDRCSPLCACPGLCACVRSCDEDR